MHRRRFCAGLLAGAAGALAGCRTLGREDPAATTDATDASRTPTPDRTPSTATTRDVPSLAEPGYPADIYEAGVVEGFTSREIVEPTFAATWRGHDVDPKYVRDEPADGLAADATVVGRVHDGRARASPISLLWHHEIVNDDHGGPLMVTFCSICRSGLVAERVVDGEPTRFGVSGQLWRPPDRYTPASQQAGVAFGAVRWGGADSTSVRNGANLVMYDERTGSFWSQAIARAICGPARGTRLPLVPFELDSWSDWRAAHPDTEVLLPPPHSAVDLDGSG